MENQNKYQNAKIYKITDIAYSKCYIGCTTEELSQRMARHRNDFKRFLNGELKYLCFIR
jgi:predicted GIY-YIG superfamily endonuclease